MKYELKHSTTTNGNNVMFIKVEMIEILTMKVIDTTLIKVTGYSIANDPELLKFKDKLRILNLEAEDDKLYVKAVNSF